MGARPDPRPAAPRRNTMSLTAQKPAPTLASPAAGGRLALLACAALASALVLGSGAARWWQARQVAAELLRGRESKFPLDSLPMAFGDWVGERTELDPQIVARTGSNDLITRRYVNKSTGAAVELIALHGPAADIFVHSPELCYPRAGFASYGEVLERAIPAQGREIPFRSAAYTRGDPPRADTQEVFFSWRYNGRWTTQVNRPKEMERIPGMYKVQVSRRLERTESRSVANPSEAFLRLFVPAIEARIRGESATTTAAEAGPDGARAARSEPTSPGAPPR
jgi:hypothetical protein